MNVLSVGCNKNPPLCTSKQLIIVPFIGLENDKNGLNFRSKVTIHQYRWIY